MGNNFPEKRKFAKMYSLKTILFLLLFQSPSLSIKYMNLRDSLMEEILKSINKIEETFK